MESSIMDKARVWWRAMDANERRQMVAGINSRLSRIDWEDLTLESKATIAKSMVEHDLKLKLESTKERKNEKNN